MGDAQERSGSEIEMGAKTDVPAPEPDEEEQRQQIVRTAKEELADLNRRIDAFTLRKKELETFLRVADSLVDIGAP